MITVHKFLIMLGENHVDMPIGAMLKHAAMQDDSMYVWAYVNTNLKLERRHVFVVGTGHSVDGRWSWVDTVHVPPFVWHVFDAGPCSGTAVT